MSNIDYEALDDRERIIAIQRNYNLEHGMSEEQADRYEIEQRKRMAAQGTTYTAKKEPSIFWNLVRLVLGLIGVAIGVYSLWFSFHLHP